MGWKLPTLTAVLWVVALTVVSVMLGLVIAGPDGMLFGAIPLALGTVLAGYVPAIRDRVRERESAHQTWRGTVEPSLPRSWARLLDPRREVVGFVGRNEELSALVAWCEDDQASRLRLVTGPGGVGKTRLAVELAKRMGADGWQCERVADGKEAEAISALRAVTGGRALLTVDYAEARIGLRQMLTDLAGDQGAGVRVLLLARSGGDWWEQLGVGEPLVWDMAQAAKSAELSLAPAIAEELSDADIVEQAARAFARELAVAERAVEIDGSGTVRRRVLDLHAAALVAVLDKAGTSTVRVNIRTVLDELLRHEMHYWYDSARAGGLCDGPDGLTPLMLRRIVAAACLLGAATEEEARLLPGRVPGLSPSARLAHWLRDLYPPGPGDLDWLGSLQPDRLGELHVVRAFAASPELARACLDGLDARQARRALTLLARASVDDPRAEVMLSQVLPNAAGFIADLDAPIELLAAIFNAIPFRSVTLAPTAAAVIQRIMTLLPADTKPATRAYWLSVLGAWFSLLGRPSEALAADQQAIAIYRELTAADRDRYRRNLAGSLHNLGVVLSELGGPGEALPVVQEALAIRQDLAATRPDRYRFDLAASLASLGGNLWELGRSAEALTAIEQAVGIYRELAATEPDLYRAELAEELSNFGVALAELGRSAEALPVAEESVGVYRELAAADPDRYRPNLATLLSNLGARLSELRRPADALTAEREAVAIRRQLAAFSFERYGPALAASLMNIGVPLAQLDRVAEALPLAEEALGIYRELAADNPDRYRPDVAAALRNLGIKRGALDDTEALPVVEEAVSLYRDLAARNPDRYRPDLAESLVSLGMVFRRLDRPADALIAGWEAVVTYRDLAADNPDRYRFNLAASLNSLSITLIQLGHPAKALSATEEAVGILRNLVTTNAARCRSYLAQSLSKLADLQEALGQETQAHSSRNEAIEIGGESG